MKCTNCDLEKDSLKTAIKKGRMLRDMCDSCLNSFIVSSSYARQYERNEQRKQYRKDIIQRYEGDKINPEFIRAYPEESVAQWGEDVVRDLSTK